MGSWLYDLSTGWAVGEAGTTMRWDGSAWTVVPSPTLENLYAVHVGGSNDVWAVGANGTLIHWNGTRWDLFRTNTTVRLNAVRAMQGQLIVLGDDGVNLVLVYPPP